MNRAHSRAFVWFGPRCVSAVLRAGRVTSCCLRYWLSRRASGLRWRSFQHGMRSRAARRGGSGARRPRARWAGVISVAWWRKVGERAWRVFNVCDYVLAFILVLSSIGPSRCRNLQTFEARVDAKVCRHAMRTARRRKANSVY